MELRDYVRGLRRHWLAIVLLTLIGTAAAYGWTLLQKPVYEATANGVVQSQATAEQGGSLAGDTTARAKVPTLIEMVGWKAVAERAIEDLGLTESPEQVASRIVAENPTGTAIVRVTAQGGSPEAAAELARAWIDALAAVNAEVDANSGIETIPISIYLAEAAIVSSEPVSPDTRTALLVGAILGLGAGIAFALVRTASDRRIRVTDDIESRVHVTVVGSIPSSPTLAGSSPVFQADSGGGAKGGAFAVAEGLRTLRTNLRFMDVDHPPRTIVVTSPLPGDGKSTIACNLAVTLARSGTPVILIDGDLRRPMVARNMGLPGGAGLSDVLTERAHLTEVLQRTSIDPNLLVLAAGTIPPNPSEVLGSTRMRQLIADLAKHATVIIDAPPLLAVTDGAVLTHQADGALLVVSVGKTTYDFVEKAVETLQKANGRALGIVLNKTPLKGVDASPYASAAYAREYARETKGADASTTSASAETVDTPVAHPAPKAETEHAADSKPAAKPGRPPGKSGAQAKALADADDAGSELTFDALREMAATSADPEPPRARRPRRSQR